MSRVTIPVLDANEFREALKCACDLAQAELDRFNVFEDRYDGHVQRVRMCNGVLSSAVASLCDSTLGKDDAEIVKAAIQQIESAFTIPKSKGRAQKMRQAIHAATWEIGKLIRFQ